MQHDEIKAEISSLLFQIDDHEKMFDVALLDPKRLGYAKQLYKDIKVLEARIAELKSKQIDENPDGDVN